MPGFQKAADIWRSLEPRAQLTLVGSAVAVVATFFFLFQLSSRPSWVTVASGMEATESGDVTKSLESAGITYELRDGGGSVAVKSGQEAKARVALAEDGLPNGGHVGFEIFDNKSLGATDFQQKVDYQRALEGEISRTIESVDGVRSAQVQLVLPEKSLFLDDGTAASAAVLVQGGSTLDRGAVAGIANLVSSSVEGLKTDDVTITDEGGSLLWPAGGGAGGSSITAQLEAEQRYGTQLSAQINSMLATTLGPGKSEARVHADLDVDEKKVDSVTYGDQGVPLAKKEDTETLTFKGAAPNGTAGVAGNLPGYAGNGSASGESNYEKSSGSTDFGVDKRVESTVVAPGTVRRLSVSLVVDKDVPGATVDALKQSVAGMAGIDAKRGDTMSVAQIDFAEGANSAYAKPGPLDAAGGPLGIAKWLGLGVATLLFLMMVRRGLKRREGDPIAPEPTWLREITAAQPLAELEAAAPPPVRKQVSPASLRATQAGEQLDEIIRRQPESVASQVAQWMNE